MTENAEDYTKMENHANNKKVNELFDDFMLHRLASSEDYIWKLVERNQHAVNFYLAVFTALIGGAVFVIINIQNETMRLTALALDLLVTSGFGFLTYLWLISGMASVVEEGVIVAFLSKYFSDKNPSDFEKYGLSEFSTWYTRLNDSYSPSITQAGASAATLISLILSSSLLISGAVFAGWKALAGQSNIFLSAIFGLACMIGMIVAFRIYQKKVRKTWNKGKSLWHKHHIDI
jgi:hypothetical protein